ncbi:hypothetical protein [Streptomyces sp. NPDC052036]|uniref:hypothetical protein n=1 Tax=unclassified Streptomyces TaxID=2593676 RepID=UPI003448587E
MNTFKNGVAVGGPARPEPGYRRVPCPGSGARVAALADGSIRGRVGVADGLRVGTAALLGVPDAPDRGLREGSGLTDPGGLVTEEEADREADGVGGSDRPLAGGGARGTTGEAGD